MPLQVYMLLSCCPCEGRISGIVDIPNACATLAIPTAIFDQVWPPMIPPSSKIDLIATLTKCRCQWVCKSLHASQHVIAGLQKGVSSEGRLYMDLTWTFDQEAYVGSL